jgi:hypothetical protein
LESCPKKESIIGRVPVGDHKRKRRQVKKRRKRRQPMVGKARNYFIVLCLVVLFLVFGFVFLQTSSSSNVSERKKKHLYTKEHIDRHTNKNTYNIMLSTKIGFGLFGWRESMTRDAC